MAKVLPVDLSEMTEVAEDSVLLVQENDSTKDVKKVSFENLTKGLATLNDNGEVNEIPKDVDIWEYLYYADEDDSNPRVLGMNTETMTLAKEIALLPNAHAGSVDRAGFLDKMYVRTAGHRHIEVINPVSGKFIKKIDLNFKPRSSGGYNRYRGLQAMSTKENPYVNVIDVASDTVVITVGSTGGSPHGNDGGNATGHTIWLDADHFALLDRHNVNVQIYKINESKPPYTTTLTQTLATPTGCHSLRSLEAGLLLQDRTFYAGIEGSLADVVVPQIIKYTFDSSTGELSQVGAPITFPGTDENWSIHHFGINSDIIAVPVTPKDGSNNGKGIVFTIDLANWTLNPTTYNAGLGAGHCDYSKTMNTFVVTNHYDNYVTLLELNTDTVTNVTIADETISWGHYTQSHANHISKDGLFYYFFETANGIFMEIDLVNKVVSRQVATGGEPIQSYS